MAHLDLRRLQQQLERKDPQSIYLLIGEEPFLMDEAIRVIKQKTLSQGAEDFNYDNFYVTEVSGEHVRDTVETLPVMVPRRLVILKGAHQFKEKDWSALYPVIDKPVESSVLILVAEKIDKRKKVFKRIEKTGQIVDLKRPYENQLPAWISYIASKHNLRLSQDAVALLQQFVGSNLAEISSELSKLRVFLGHRDFVEGEDVMNAVSRSKIENVFSLTTAIGKRDRAHALTCLANLLEHGQNEVGALALIGRHIRILSNLKEGQKKGLAGSKLSAKAGIPSFFLNEYLSQLPQWNERKISDTTEALYETDKALKSSPVSSHIWLENFIIKTCSQ